MPPTNIFGRELPSHVQRDKALSPHENHASAKEKMLETVIHHAEGVREMLRWTDSVTGSMTREEVSEQFSAHAQEAFHGISEMFIEEVAALLREKQNRWEWRKRKEALEQSPNFFFVYEVLQWYLAMSQAWDEVNDLCQNPARLSEEINKALAAQGRSALEPEDTVDRILEPFCIHIVLTPEAFQRIDHEEGIDDKRDTLGIFLAGTHFSFIEASDIEREEVETMRHESGHQLIDKAPSFGQGDVLLDIQRGFGRVGRDRSVSSPSRKDAEWNRQRLWKRTRASAVDRLHNEFLAELNVARHWANEELEGKHWSTAENDADGFARTNEQEIQKLRPLKSKFAKKLAASPVDIDSRFQREKKSVIHALRLASFLPDPDARLFVAALAFVMPVRSYHHIKEALERKYSQEEVERAEHEV